ncbi:hypothetical protein BKA70DRAFT_1558232 [Coprinopsis sp. MPI-PUGE-AT-0042]|nr:hypothetical protein BKA70DRAFT_1558232 [Coprinopsis sp. MPI-PUGE-AT-0042]
MPVPLWSAATNKAEAKYNVVTEFPQLGLHAAAASGNVGLVEYALKHGQPINSVLDGVLPIHAAAAGGHPQVVKKLIEHGADVNAPRLPRRYFSDKNRDSSAPIVGTSGSTPLHFAAANGNTSVITLLLLHGAHPDRADKYGVTPEALARENNWVECADILQNWILNKDRDLRERETLIPSGSGAASSIPPEPESPSFRRRLHVKHSIDTALNMLKSSSHSDTSLRPYPAVSTASPPPSPMAREFDNYDTQCQATSRRPSLPHTLQPPPTLVEFTSRSPTSPRSSRRPRSAGTGAERSSENEPIYLPHGRGGAGRKLGGKLSLLGLFKKAQQVDGSDTSNTSTPPRLSTSSTPLPFTPSTTSLTRASPGSALEVLDPVELHRTHRNHASGDTSARGLKINPPPNGRLQPPATFLELDSPVTPSPTARVPPPLPSALDLHNVLAGKRPQGRDRSRSNATTVSTLSDLELEDDSQAKLAAVSKTFKPMPGRDRSGSSTAPAPNLPDIAENRQSGATTADEEKGFYPPGILKGHRRTSSNSQPSPSPGRALRFDSASTPDRVRREAGSAGSSSNQVPQLRTSSSSQSLKPSLREDSRIQSSPRIHVEKSFAEEDSSLVNSSFDYSHGGYHSHILDGEEEDDDLHAPDASSQTELRSFDSPSRPSLSPLFGEVTTSQRSLASVCADLPFSINRPPPVPTDSPENSLRVMENDRRGRGDSISSTCTTDSTNAPQYSTSGSTIGSSASPMLSTPSGGSLPLPSTREVNEDEGGYDGVIVEGEPSKSPPQVLNGPTLIQRRAQTPLDIDIRDISSHADADALVERNRQEILAFASGQGVTSGSSVGTTTPLSARLAAYGESLALQKRLKEKEAEVLAQSAAPVSPPSVAPPPATALDFHRSGVARQLSLGKPAPSRTKPKKDPRRPSTADGLQSRKGSSFFANDSTGPSRSLSSAPRPFTSNGLTSFDEQRQFPPPSRGLATSISASTSLFSPPEGLVSPTSVRGFAARQEDDLESFASDSLVSDTEPSPVIRHVASFTSAGARNRPVPGRNTGSAKKLNRMGFTVVDQAARPTVAPPPPAPGKLRGGFKSIMQTLKGKS